MAFDSGSSLYINFGRLGFACEVGSANLVERLQRK